MTIKTFNEKVDTLDPHTNWKEVARRLKGVVSYNTINTYLNGGVHDLAIAEKIIDTATVMLRAKSVKIQEALIA